MTAWKFLPVALTALAAACTLPVVVSGPASTSAPANTRRTSTESRIFDLINAQRVHQGLPALVYNEQLDRMAKIQAENMAHYQKMSHVIPEATLPTLPDRARYVSYQFGRLAENVALGYPNAETVVQGWMTSKGHRANILNNDLVETGIGIARSSSGGLYYCQVFGRRLEAPPNPL